MTDARIVGRTPMKENAMSTASYDQPLRLAPDIPTTKAKFAEVFNLRYAARKAFDKARAVTRSAAGWAIDLFHRWVEATGCAGVLSWVSAQARNAVGLIRRAGVVPSVLAVLTTPPVAATAVRVAKVAGRGLLRVAKAAWNGIQSVLGRCGRPGSQIDQSLSHTGTQIADAVRSVAKHPMTQPGVHTFGAALALVRPVSQGFVANRLLAALVPILWLRAVIGFLFIPFLVDSTVVGNMWNWATARPSTPQNDDTEGTDDSDLLMSTFAVPMPGRTVPSDVQPAEVAEQADPVDQADQELADGEPSLNRASRRAQQREDAHVWRMQHPRS
jgi:hypothetical protein